MTKSEMVDNITRHSVFSGFTKEENDQLKAIVSSRSARVNEIVFDIDDPPNHIYYLTDGELNLHFPDNSRIHIKPNDLIGEIGILNGDFRLGKLVAQKDSHMIAVCAHGFFDPAVLSPSVSLEIIRRLSKRVTNYLRSKQQTSSKELIQAGENDHIEFKSTLRWNVKSKKKDTNITYAILKTIAAFLNYEGGTLFVGVDDDSNILGLELDQFQTNDKLLLFVTNIIKSNIGTLFLKNIHFHTESINNKTILRVDVQAADNPCFIADKLQDHFYVRTGPSTTDLRMSQLYEYIKKRFG